MKKKKLTVKPSTAKPRVVKPKAKHAAKKAHKVDPTPEDVEPLPEKAPEPLPEKAAETVSTEAPEVKRTFWQRMMD